jgi:hypothetical protein
MIGDLEGALRSALQVNTLPANDGGPFSAAGSTRTLTAIHDRTSYDELVDTMVRSR